MLIKSIMLTAVATLGLTTAAGAVTTYTTSSLFPTNDTLDWGQLGNGANWNSPTTAISAGGLSVTATNTGDVGGKEYVEAPTGPWEGIFADGANLLYSKTNVGGVLTLTFANAVSGVGFDAQSNAFGNFTATLTAYDAANNVIGTVSNSANNNGASLNTAPFLGIDDGAGDIAYVTISTTNDDLGFAIDAVLLDHTLVPEPASLALLGAGLAGLGFARRRKV